ncbi:hypothetical protein [Streptomyces bambusae]|uniref:DUF3137 domain-containing protein n=1 Tax=Streptomyces bambusae TaxID=1550616 RepID=A0ABS6Z8B8_9ACTN|nr:hypothetical protein [Streptomyces bambusae]MBW5484012.1 hypothetical protein [Streptomyces bambusae]
MITEPELDGSSDPEDRPLPGEAVSSGPAGGSASASASAAARRGRRPWLWALGGALTASAVWAAGLWWLGEAGPGAAPRYRWAEYLCDDFKAPALSRFTGLALEKRKLEANLPHRVRPWTGCQLRAEADGRTYVAMAEVTLYHERDPAPEFDQEPQIVDPWYASDGRTVESVPGLGERALLSYDGPFGDRTLRVLDGRAVFSLKFTAQRDFRQEQGEDMVLEADPRIDFTAAQAAMVEDLRTLMRTLRK